jgi:hypothetical protein
MNDFQMVGEAKLAVGKRGNSRFTHVLVQSNFLEPGRRVTGDG